MTGHLQFGAKKGVCYNFEFRGLGQYLWSVKSTIQYKDHHVSSPWGSEIEIHLYKPPTLSETLCITMIHLKFFIL